MFKENRIGMFRIIGEDIHNFTEVVRKLMAHMVIIRAEHRFDENAIHYVAHSPLFEIIERGVCAPEYEIQVECGSFMVTRIGTGNFADPTLRQLKMWNPIIEPIQGSDKFKIFLPEKSAEIAIDLTIEQANIFCRAFRDALIHSLDLDKAIEFAGKVMRA